MAALLIVATVATSCGAFTGNNPDEDDGLTVVLTPALTPSATPDSGAGGPTATPDTTSATADAPTPLPLPTATPSVEDTYVTLVASARNVFGASDKAAAIAAIVPAPIDLTIPADADLQRLDVAYDRWDFWEVVTGNFAPVDRAANVVIEYRFLTATGIDEIATAYREPLLEAGFEVTVDDSDAGIFADTQYTLNGGFFRPGRGGTARLITIRQGDLNLVEFEIATELDTDTEPAITDWPTMFPVPFAGGFTSFTMFAVSGESGIEVSSTASWTLSAVVTDRRLVLLSLMEEYPTATVTLDGEVVQATANSIAVTTFAHPTGASGSITVDTAFDATVFEFRLVSLPG